MTISITNSFVTQEAFEYSQLCYLAKAKWDWDETNKKWTLNDPQKKYTDVWKEISENYSVYFFKDETSTTGYSGTVFKSISDGKLILANRGTDGLTSDDRAAVTSIATNYVRETGVRSCIST
jgi:beta-N-acetylglucosaminidase